MHFALEPNDPSSDRASIHASYDLTNASLEMPASSLFSGTTVQQAQKYFVELYVAFASWPENDYWSAVRIDRSEWKVVSLDPPSDNPDKNMLPQLYSFMQNSRIFRPGECKLDSMFYVHDLDYHWHQLETSVFNQPLAKNDKAIMYFDGSCPLCVKEVGHYQRLSEKYSSSLEFYDISTPEDQGGLGHLKLFHVNFDDAVARIHVIDETGTLHTGARAFLVIWERLPYWRVLSMIVSRIPFAIDLAEALYKVFARYRFKHLRCVPGDDSCGLK